MKKPDLPIRASAAALAILLAGNAHAEFSTDGYLRAGTGATAGDHSTEQSCFGLSGDGLKYRLGNECDTYVEVNLKDTMKVGSVQFSTNIMPVYWSQSQANAASQGLGQAYVEGSGFDFAPKVNFWAGKRYYGRADIHIVDTKYTKLDGTGGGADNIDLGFGKIGVAYFRRESLGAPYYQSNSSTFPGWGAASRVNLEFTTSNVNPGGWLRVLGTYVISDENLDKDGNALQGHNGTALTIQHYQDKLFGLGGGNTVWLQFARGSAGLDGNFRNAYNGSGNDWVAPDPGSTTGSWQNNHSDTKSARVADAFNWQVGNFGGQAMAHLQTDNNTQYTTRSTSLGARLSYAFTANFKLLGEAGVSKVKPGSGDEQRLSKFTIAPTIAVGRGFWERPELRLYYTHATWNEAAAAAGNSLPSGRTSGNRYGVQAEIWW